MHAVDFILVLFVGATPLRGVKEDDFRETADEWLRRCAIATVLKSLSSPVG